MSFVKSKNRFAWFLAGLITFPSVALSLSPIPPSETGPGLSAVWYDADNSGTGWVVEMLDNERVAAYWYTFDEDGKPRWAVGSGRLKLSDWAIPYFDIPDLYAGSGARFGAAFDAGDVELKRVGSVEFSFKGCQSGGFGGEAFGEAFAQLLDRLTRTMGAGCSPINGIPGEPVKDYAGLSGAWYNPDRAGEGFTLQWMARDEALVYWFTYDTEGNPFWLFGLGEESGGEIEIAELYSAERDPDGVVNLTTWGTLTLNLACNAGTLEYDSVEPGFGAGSIPVQRLNALAAPKCPYVAPTFTDLYDIDLVILPLAAGEIIDVTSVADDGTVSGLRQLQNGSAEAVLLPLGATTWATIGGQALDADLPLFISNDALMLRGNADEFATPNSPVDWSPTDGWSPAPGFAGETAQGTFSLFGVSSDFMAFTGKLSSVNQDEDSVPWVYHPAAGQRVLPVLDGDGLGSAVATDISNDGRTVIGSQNWSRPIIPELAYAADTLALLWKDGGSPQVLEDNENGSHLADARLCNADCSIVYGSDSSFSKLDVNRPIPGQTWAWTGDRGVTRIDRPGGDAALRGQDWPMSTTDDGYLMAGSSNVGAGPIDPVPPDTAFLWTQATGTVNINTLLNQLGYEIDFRNSYASAVAVSSDGTFIALQPDAYNETRRAALMILTPRSE